MYNDNNNNNIYIKALRSKNISDGSDIHSRHVWTGYYNNKKNNYPPTDKILSEWNITRPRPYVRRHSLEHPNTMFRAPTLTNSEPLFF